MKRKLLDLRFHQLIVQLAAHLLSYGKLIHQTVPFRNQGWRAGAATMPALNSRLVWRHPVPIFAKTNQICSFLENNPRKRIPSGWDWVGGAANVLGLWTGLLSPHPPHTHEEGKARGGGPAHRYKDPPKQPYLTSCSSELNQ